MRRFKHHFTRIILSVLLSALGAGPVAAQATAAASGEFPFQQRIREYVFGDSISSDAGYVYYWPRLDSSYVGDDVPRLGTARNIDYLGTRLSTVRKNKGTHCVGITWQLGMSILSEWAATQGSNGAIAGLSLDDMREFIRRWFVKQSPGGGLAPPEESGVVYALESFGLGRAVSMEDAETGDFVQFWRLDGSGHSCVFLRWVYDREGNVIGFKYWGSQPQTDGIGTDTEYFAPDPTSIEPERLLNRDRFYVGRLYPKAELAKQGE